MPISYSLETPGIDIHVEIAGKVSPQDLIAYMRDLMQKFETLDGKRALIEVGSISPGPPYAMSVFREREAALLWLLE